ncbi:MAG: fatty acid-binding protein DegV, partial [Clostridia bacterium]|nr:fatty acid-binding protein DegV [Clostridia bacterium]
MKQFALITNSTIDEDAAYYHDHEVGYAPLQYTLDGTTYTEDFWQSLSAKEFYDALREGKMCMTSQTAVETYLKLYWEALERGQDVLYLGFSSGLSGSFQAGV